MRLCAALCLLLFVFVSNAEDYPEDPYAVLGLSRRATTKEIKGAYKSLVKEWHPDKNSSPDAAEKFMEISKAYEVLSDPLKRERFDKFGTFDDGPQASHGRGGFDPFFGFGFGAFEDGFFANHRISIRQYTQTILERSNQQPFIIYAYSNYCQLCFRLQNFWKKAVNDLEPLGYGIGTVNAMTDSNLLEKLRISQLPSIVAIVEGRVIPLRHNMLQLTDRTIRQFAQKIIPAHFITKINSQPALSRFIEQWKNTNKVSVIVLGAAAEPRLRYLLASMLHSQFARFAYIHLGDPSEEVAGLRQSLLVKCTQCENVLIYNDFQDDAVGRLSISHASQLTKEAIDTLIDKHKLLTLPRLSSPPLFDTICPVSSRSPRLLCVILPVLGSGSESAHVDAFREYVKENSQKWAAKKVQFTYIFVDKQADWIRPMIEKRKEYSNQDSARDLLVIWRLEYVKVKFAWLKASWSGRREQTDAAINEVVEGRRRLDDIARIVPLKDEYALSWFTICSRALWRMCESAWFFVTQEDTYIFLSFVGTFLLFLIGYYALNHFRENENKKKPNTRSSPHDPDWHPDDPKIRKDKESLSQNKLQRIMLTMSPLLHELRAETYFGMIRLLKPGCRSLVLIVDEENKDRLLQQFAQYVYPIRNNKTFSFGYLVVDKNLGWFRKLLEHTLPLGDDATPKEGETSLYEKLKSINPRQTVGTVLALCGWKLYFSIYHPKHAECARSHFLGFDTDDDMSDSDDDIGRASDDYSATREEKARLQRRSSQRYINVENVLDAFPNWLDRLLEGSIRRYYIPEWPENLK